MCELPLAKLKPAPHVTYLHPTPHSRHYRRSDGRERGRERNGVRGRESEAKPETKKQCSNITKRNKRKTRRISTVSLSLSLSPPHTLTLRDLLLLFGFQLRSVSFSTFLSFHRCLSKLIHFSELLIPSFSFSPKDENRCRNLAEKTSGQPFTQNQIIFAVA